MAKLIAVQLETCHANTDGTAWYAYFDGEVGDLERFKAEIRKMAKEDGAPLMVSFEDGCLEEVPSALSKATNLRRYFVAAAV